MEVIVERQSASPLRKLVMLWWMMRPWNVGLLVAWGITGGILAAGADASLSRIAVAIVLLTCGYAVGQWMNDMIDIDIDRLNCPHRPLPSGAIEIGQVRVAYIAVCVGFTAVAFLFNVWAGLICIATVGLSYGYTKLKRVEVYSSLLMVATCVSLSFPFAAAIVAGTIPPVVWLVAGSAFALELVLNISTGVGDVEGDKQQGVKTIAVLMGARAAAVISLVAMTVSVVLAALPYLLGMLSWQYLILVGIVGAVGLYSMVQLALKPTAEQCYKSGRLIKAVFVMHPLSFIAAYVSIPFVVLPLIVAIQVGTILMIKAAAKAGVLTL